jgi:MFS transporter, putative metabolite transport protein
MIQALPKTVSSKAHVFSALDDAPMAIIAAGSALCVIAPNPWLILAGQFVLGIGIGIDFPTSGSYVSEITPKASRSRMTVATIALQSVGMVAAALVGIAVLRVHPAVTDWRILLGAGGILAVLYIIARLGLPESPRWLAEKAGSPRPPPFCPL